MREHGVLLGGRWVPGASQAAVLSPFDAAPVAKVGRAGTDDLRQAILQASDSRPAMAAMALHQRAALLEAAAQAVLARRNELATVLVEEAGKPVTLAAIEVDRAAETLMECARVARSPEARLLDLAAAASGAGRVAMLRRFPVGVVVGISPFNFPLNLVAHKLGPAIAAGCPIILKPASQTPSSALLLGEILCQAGVPEGALSVVPCSSSIAGPLLQDPTVRLVTFTGSAEVGWWIKERCWNRRVGLELGGNAAVMVEPDAGDLETVARRVAAGAFAYAGQSCISVQRILVNRRILDPLRDLLVAAAEAVPTGDPADGRTVCGPLIAPSEADRIQNWVEEAQAGGARLLTSWHRVGSVVRPLLLEGVPRDAPLWSQEAFGPVAVLAAYDTFEEGLARVNDSRFGLQAGIFTRDVGRILRAYEELEVGGVIQGDIPSWRSDPMPYGGVKDSGVGREGPAWAVEEMTEPRLLVLRR